MRKIICVILALFLASSAAFAGYQIFREYTERQESADTYTDLENLISFPEVLPEEEPDETNLSESGETEPAPVGPTIEKTPAGKRKVPMLSFVKEAIIMEKERQELLDLHCIATIDGYTDFIFINRFGNPQHQGTLNKAIRRIIRDCNDEQFLKNDNPEVLLPHFSCHSLRHTFTTRMCEAGVNVKVIQDTLGHKDISTTLNIYTDVTKELRQSEFEGLDSYFKSEYNKVSNE